MDSYDRIIEAATRLFAQKGYHGTTMREIAREVGLHVATVQQHVTSKDLLYKEVFRRQYEQEYAIIQRTLVQYQNQEDALAENPEILKKFLGDAWKAMNGRFAQEPHLVRLWVYRLLERDELALELDKEYSLSLFQIGLDQVENTRQAGAINPERIMVLLWLSDFAWLQMGYFAGRNLVADLEQGNPLDPKVLDKFYAFLDMYVDRMLDLNPSKTRQKKENHDTKEVFNG